MPLLEGPLGAPAPPPTPAGQSQYQPRGEAAAPLLPHGSRGIFSNHQTARLTEAPHCIKSMDLKKRSMPNFLILGLRYINHFQGDWHCQVTLSTLPPQELEPVTAHSQKLRSLPHGIFERDRVSSCSQFVLSAPIGDLLNSYSVQFWSSGFNLPKLPLSG